MKTIFELTGNKSPKPFMQKGFMLTGCSHPSQIFGAELEIEGCDKTSDEYIELFAAKGWTITNDQSLRGRNLQAYAIHMGYAYEFITKPMRQDHLLFALDDFFKVTKFTDKNYSDRCSVHLHVNCCDMTQDQLSNLVLLYSVVEEILFKFVGEDRENNIYCIPWSQCRMSWDIVNKIFNEGPGCFKRWQKYTALNLAPLLTQGTVEFRHMHGTADMKKLSAWINIIGQLFKVAQATELQSLVDDIKKLNSNSEYEVFFNRVLGGQLPYSEDYCVALEAGVINAKVGMINWKKADKTTVEINGVNNWRDLIAMAEEVIAVNPGAVPQHNRFSPWPLDNTRIRVDEQGLNEVERSWLTTRALRACWEWVDGTTIRIITQPNPRDGVVTVQRSMEHQREVRMNQIRDAQAVAQPPRAGAAPMVHRAVRPAQFAAADALPPELERWFDNRPVGLEEEEN